MMVRMPRSPESILPPEDGASLLRNLSEEFLAGDPDAAAPPRSLNPPLGVGPCDGIAVDRAPDSIYNCHTNDWHHIHFGLTGRPSTVIGNPGNRRVPPRFPFPDGVNTPHEVGGPDTAMQGG